MTSPVTRQTMKKIVIVSSGASEISGFLSSAVVVVHDDDPRLFVIAAGASGSCPSAPPAWAGRGSGAICRSCARKVSAGMKAVTGEETAPVFCGLGGADAWPAPHRTPSGPPGPGSSILTITRFPRFKGGMKVMSTPTIRPARAEDEPGSQFFDVVAEAHGDHRLFFVEEVTVGRHGSGPTLEGEACADDGSGGREETRVRRPVPRPRPLYVRRRRGPRGDGRFGRGRSWSSHCTTRLAGNSRLARVGFPAR